MGTFFISCNKLEIDESCFTCQLAWWKCVIPVANWYQYCVHMGKNHYVASSNTMLVELMDRHCISLYCLKSIEIEDFLFQFCWMIMGRWNTIKYEEIRGAEALIGAPIITKRINTGFREIKMHPYHVPVHVLILIMFQWLTKIYS